jgi:IMP dehydrogenase
MMEHYHISGVPICDPDGKLQGIITNRDLRFETNLNKQIKEYQAEIKRGRNVNIDKLLNEQKEYRDKKQC